MILTSQTAFESPTREATEDHCTEAGVLAGGLASGVILRKTLYASVFSSVKWVIVVQLLQESKDEML